MIPDSTNVRVMADNIRKLKTEVENAVELPSVETTDEGKVLTVNSSGKWAALDPASQLPDVTSEDEGSLLTVNSSGVWAKGNSIVGNLDYSETEQDTGLKWIDGKTIYRRTFIIYNDSEATSPATKDIVINETIDKIIAIDGVGIRQDYSGQYVYFNLTNPTINSNYSTARVTRTNTSYTITHQLTFTTGSYGGAFITIYYTKPTESREPHEPETKKSTKRKTTKGEN